MGQVESSSESEESEPVDLVECALIRKQAIIRDTHSLIKKDIAKASSLGRRHIEYRGSKYEEIRINLSEIKALLEDDGYMVKDIDTGLRVDFS